VACGLLLQEACHGPDVYIKSSNPRLSEVWDDHIHDPVDTWSDIKMISPKIPRELCFDYGIMRQHRHATKPAAGRVVVIFDVHDPLLCAPEEPCSLDMDDPSTYCAPTM